ncbi:hypothetical protein ZHAS_00007527 [Anopheles sinensis]|uniref:Uncharacterized protein n=1 Tax=Anopheles sinensis TaxID=74873 RepID=A0A084VQ22_ANOSI|nr:hypothetical protein ZHAS_00007527 [Anopheles sinensis]
MDAMTVFAWKRLLVAPSDPLTDPHAPPSTTAATTNTVFIQHGPSVPISPRSFHFGPCRRSLDLPHSTDMIQTAIKHSPFTDYTTTGQGGCGWKTWLRGDERTRYQ